MLNIVLFGPPGAGKGTQAATLVTKYDLIHLSTGDIFRANIKGETELGILAKGYMDGGNLVPDQVTISMLESEVDKHPNATGFIFDGFPRTTPQAEALEVFLNGKNTTISLMLALDVQAPELGFDTTNYLPALTATIVLLGYGLVFGAIAIATSLRRDIE